MSATEPIATPAKKHRIDDADVKLPKYDVADPPPMHVNASDITLAWCDENLLLGQAKANPQMTYVPFSTGKTHWKVVLNSGGVLPPEGLRVNEKFGGLSLDVYVADPRERQGLRALSAWIAARCLVPSHYEAKLRPTTEQMHENHKQLLDAESTLHLKVDTKEPAQFKAQLQPGQIGNCPDMSAEERASLGGKPWSRIAFRLRLFYTKGLESGVSTSLAFLRAEPYGAMSEPVAKVSCDLDS